ncbi:MAG: hypothetical protein R6V72_22145, partial [Cyclobacterium sp.]|uniref:hypothetical protein n=1 Tax=Cyclobacterium sp. TaxID=1966343 RepID=UPI0039705CEB
MKFKIVEVLHFLRKVQGAGTKPGRAGGLRGEGFLCLDFFCFFLCEDKKKENDQSICRVNGQL